MRTRVALLILALGLVLAAAPARAIVAGQTEDFSAGLGGWERGQIATPGFEGADDPYLLVNQGDGGRLVTFERAIWAGDYPAAGVDEISLLVRNFGATDLVVRLAIGDNQAPMLGGSWYATDGVPLLAGSDWQRVSFSLAPAALVQIQGSASAEQVLAGVSTLRILHANGPAAIGDFLPGSLGIDAITAVPEPGAATRAAAAAAALASRARRRARWRPARTARRLARPRAGGSS